MIFGIGTDICDVRRMGQSWARRGERLAERILGEAELAVWRERQARHPERGLRYLATRFSAKEAFSKAIGLSVTAPPMSWRLCEIGNADSGAPILRLHGALQEWFEARQLRAWVSVSDERDHVFSFVVVEVVNARAIDF